ncbi:MAG: S8 family serine peptidase [Ignavibacteria bacterium]|nr:S8 family serine peptidase [Ignavibacteria bacterium]
MKKIGLISLYCLFFCLYGNLYSQGYYYNNKYIKLLERFDGLAIIFKANNYSDDEIKEFILNNLEQGDILNGYEREYCYIRFQENLLNEKLTTYKNRLSNKSDLIKFVTPVYYGDSRSVTQFPKDEFFVRLKDFKDKSKLEMLNLEYNCYIKGVIGDENCFVIKTFDDNNKDIFEIIELYYRTGLFIFVEPNMVYLSEGFFNYIPDDPLFALQWALYNTGQAVNTDGYASYGDSVRSCGFPGADMDVYLAWDYVRGNSSVKIAVFDTGVDSLHPDLSANLSVGYNAFANNNTVTIDTGNHGTCTLGIIGARTNNSIGISGIAGGNSGNGYCQISAFRLVTNSGTFVSSDLIARAFDSCRVRNFHISSNSWGGGTPSSVLDTAISRCARLSRDGLGCVILFSSGNDGRNPPNYPSYLPFVVCVGASTKIDNKKSPGNGDQFWWGGNWGEYSLGDLDVVAPTICVTTDKRGAMGYNSSDYDSTFNGTSCSCPNAAGVVALIFSVNPNLTREQAIEYLYRGCEKIDNVPYSINKTYGKWNPYYGYGRVNAYYSVRLAAGVDVTPPTINHTNVSVSSSTYSYLISAEIIDQDGNSVPASGVNAPLLYYRKNKNGAGWSEFTSIKATSNSGNTFYFYIPCSGWQTEIEYYILAKDNSGNATTFPKNAPNYPCYTAIGTTTVETGKFSAFTLPTSGVAVSGNLNMNNYKILDTEIRLYLRHTYVSDFNLSLWNPSSDTKRNKVCLFSRNGGSGDNITGAMVSDAGLYYWRESSPPYTNLSVKPDHPFTGFKGVSSGGNWKLLYYDAVSGDGGTLDSARLNITRLSGTTSPCARWDYLRDSVVNFGTIIIPDTEKYYLCNVGTANLTVSGFYFSGTYANWYQVINTPATSIAPDDSTLFLVRCNTPSGDFILENNRSMSDAIENAVLNISTNDPSKPTLKISLQTETALPVLISAFSYYINERNVHLKWSTSQEINNFGFDVERRRENENWIKLGFVKGAGNSNEPRVYFYEDKKLNIGKYFYRLKQIDYNGNYNYFDLSESVDVGLPSKFELSQNYPNPFNASTKIDYALPVDGKVLICIYDLTGREIMNVVNEKKFAGYYTAEINAAELSTGVYFYRLSVDGNNGCKFVLTKKMVLVK